jgi:hypothetical protein
MTRRVSSPSGAENRRLVPLFFARRADGKNVAKQFWRRNFLGIDELMEAETFIESYAGTKKG